MVEKEKKQGQEDNKEDAKTENHLIAEKLRKLNDIREKGINPYPYTFEKTHSSTIIKEKFKNLKQGEKSEEVISFAGRIMNLRPMGKASFCHISDEQGKQQAYLNQDVLGKEKYKLLKKIDIGDILGVKGNIFVTRTGEITINVTDFELLCKSIRPLPEKYHGLTDKEKRYRKRYLDLIMNQDIKDIFIKRSLMIKYIREFMDERGFMEVETPLLQTQYGGANAKPFITHIHAWDMKMYLSISPELHLKRLIAGGFEKVYTLCKNFRNEGVDHSHNPEFTMIEAYQSYADYNDMMKLIEECYEYVCLKLLGTTKVKRKISVDGKEEEVELEFKAPWPRKTMVESIKEHLNIDVDKMGSEELNDYCEKNLLEFEKGASWGDLVLIIFDELVEDKIIQPTHVIDRPKESSPLCKVHREDERFIEQCEPICAGMETGNMYSELNDPVRQKELLHEQVEKGRGGDEEAHPMDEDFLEAIETGMPPTGGIGWGIDRMAILLLGQQSIRDVILFPTMKPLDDE